MKFILEAPAPSTLPGMLVKHSKPLMNKYIFAKFSKERKAERLGEGKGKTKDGRRKAEADLKHSPCPLQD